MSAERRLPRPFKLPWGKGQVVEEVSVVHDHWRPTIQLLEYEDGSLSVRFCVYSPEGRFRRQTPIWMAEDFDAFRMELEDAPRLQALVRRMAAYDAPPDAPVDSQ